MSGAAEVVAEWLHATYGGKIGYCHHEDDYQRCRADAALLEQALTNAGLAIVPAPLSPAVEHNTKET